MLLDIVIDSDSIIWLFNEIVKGVVIGLIGSLILTNVFISAHLIVKGNKIRGFQLLMQGVIAAGLFILLIFLVDFSFGFNLFNYLIS
ncbi:hypothetical protein ACVTLO_00035 [Staphylococcus aureus]|nr:hypothetical protein [Staphylococcus aureus]